MMLLIMAWLFAAAVQNTGDSSTLGLLTALPPHQQTAARPAGGFQKVYGNWALSCDDPEFLGHRIAFDLTLDPSGRIVEGPTLVRPRSDAGWRRAAESAREALLRSAPSDMPADFAGGEYRPTFDTSRACARAAEADEH